VVLQETAICCYPEPGQSNLHLPISRKCILILSVHLCLGFQNGLFFLCFPTKTLYAPELSTILATCPAHLDLLYLISRTKFGEQYRSKGLLAMWFPPFPSYLVPLRPKYPPQHIFLKHPQPTFLPQHERPSFVPIQNNRRNNRSVYFIRIFLDAGPSGRAA